MKSKYVASNCGMGLVLVFAFAVLTGCASRGVLPAKNLSDAEMAIRVAKETNATVNAPLDIRLAEEKLQKAQESVHKKDYVSAQRLADEALMDAQLAQEKSRTTKIKNMEADLRESIETLQNEIDRKKKP